MSLFHSQTIFNILITLIICSAMFLFFRAKMRILEISQREQAKVLHSLVISMRNGGHSREDMVSDDEIMKHVQMQMQLQQGGAGASAGAGNQNRHTNDLIDVSDDDEEEDDESESSSSSSSSSDSEDDETDSEEEDNEDNEDNHENTTKKIIFNNSGTLDIHSHTLEHLTGDDIKVIELSEPLYAVGGGNVSGTKDLNHHDTNDVSDDDGDDDDDDDDENASDDNGDDNASDDDDEETSDDTEVKIEELPNHASLSLHQEQHLETSVTDINTIEIKTIFKADKQPQQHADYNSMNVQTLKQHLKTKLSADGLQYNETAINKLNKKELIKHLTQG